MQRCIHQVTRFAAEKTRPKGRVFICPGAMQDQSSSGKCGETIWETKRQA